jgi:hypothetical protein
MAQRKTLTQQQVALLRWIADGCPEDEMEGYSYRVSAAALRSRGLVTIKARGATWAAKLTSAGQEYLAEVDGPSPPIPRQANISVTQQLVRDVEAAGGSLRVPRRNWSQPGGIDYRHRALLAERFRKVPVGKRLEVRVVGEELEIVLVDAPDQADEPLDLVPIAVPMRVGRYHRCAREFRDLTARHEVSKAQLQRTVLLVHAIAVEAERRGWSAEVAKAGVDRSGGVAWSGSRDGHFILDAQGHAFVLRVREKGVRTRGPWEEEVHRYRNVPRESHFYRDRKLPSGPYDAEATGQLDLELDRHWSLKGRQARWGDRQGWRLEERISHLFREIEERVIELGRIGEERRLAAEQAADKARREAEERGRTWRALMREAEVRAADERRVAHLRNQADAWEEAERLRRYCRAMEEAYGDHPDTGAWIDWVRNHAVTLDPLREAPTEPDPVESTPEELQRHLPAGWRVEGPTHHHYY